ncbi:hypothetical protein T439DRAFT_350928 [Meredithblackwellia eburnea MCA 4105]
MESRSPEAEHLSAVKELRDVGPLDHYTAARWFAALKHLLTAHDLFNLTQHPHLSHPIPIHSASDPNISQARRLHQKIQFCMVILEAHVPKSAASVLVWNNPSASWTALKQLFAPVDVKKRAGIVNAWSTCRFTPDDSNHPEHHLSMEFKLERWLDEFDHLAERVMGPAQGRTAEMKDLYKDFLLSNLPEEWMGEVVLKGDETVEFVRLQLFKIASRLAQEETPKSTVFTPQLDLILQEEFDGLTSLYSPPSTPTQPTKPRTTLLSLPTEILLQIFELSLPHVSTHPFIVNEKKSLAAALRHQSSFSSLRLVSRHFASLLGHQSLIAFKNTTTIKNFIQTLYIYPERRESIRHLHINLSLPSHDRNHLRVRELVEELFSLTPRVRKLHVGGPMALHPEGAWTETWEAEVWQDTRQDVVFSVANELLKELDTCVAAGSMNLDLQRHEASRVGESFELGLFPKIWWPNLTTLSIRNEACFPAFLQPGCPPPFQLTTLSITGCGTWTSESNSILAPLEVGGCLNSLRHLSLSGVQLNRELDSGESDMSVLKGLWRRLWTLEYWLPKFELDSWSRSGENDFLPRIIPLLTSARSVTLPIMAFDSFHKLPPSIGRLNLAVSPLFQESNDQNILPEVLCRCAQQRLESGRPPLKIHLKVFEEPPKYDRDRTANMFIHIIDYWEERGGSRFVNDAEEEGQGVVELELTAAARRGVTLKKFLLSKMKETENL